MLKLEEREELKQITLVGTQVSRTMAVPEVAVTSPLPACIGFLHTFTELEDGMCIMAVRMPVLQSDCRGGRPIFATF
jgi:hypothetical protein